MPLFPFVSANTNNERETERVIEGEQVHANHSNDQNSLCKLSANSFGWPADFSSKTHNLFIVL